MLITTCFIGGDAFDYSITAMIYNYKVVIQLIYYSIQFFTTPSNKFFINDPLIKMKHV